MRSPQAIEAGSSSAQPVDFAPPDCGVCERSLLVGEAIRLYRAPDDLLVKVCGLCRDRAVELGYEALASWDSPRLRVQPSGSVSDLGDRDSLIEGLGHELAYLKQQLGAARSALTEHSLQEDAVRAISDRLRRQDRELDRLRKEADPDLRAEHERTIARQSVEIRDLRRALRERDDELARLRHARIAETNPVSMMRCALDAFNASEHCDRMARIARTLGDPEVQVTDQGSSLPRHINVLLAWDIAWYEFLVKLDLGAGRASVHELGCGGDPRSLPAPVLANAQWRESGLVLV